ncbi:hypothetical protein C5E43_08860 [Nocardia cyriacigeorgica]|uniref:helix-turn-helix domain-containing protein n=1 Tax=Nocardia cyriacigeorgica TaxID=135487 RepID=UPI000CEA069D|nr:hypothetical protein [Nocardia cyriacigeorgica]PPJ13717.1 hypothetical protein C5E43_08860 [Nocardia cyriacigeorgica]
MVFAVIGLDWTGIEVKCLRESMLLSIDAFADRIGCAPRTIRVWESRGRAARLNPGSKRLLEDRYSKLDDRERQRFETTLAEAVHVPIPTDHDAAGTENTAHDGNALSRLDDLRLAVDRTLATSSVTPSRIDLIEERVADRIRNYTTTPPSTALSGITPDLLEVQTLAADRQPAAVQARLSQAAAVLGLLTADALMKLGEVDRANYWYGTARIAADDTPNAKLQAKVRAQHAMLPYYFGDPAKTIVLARSAQALLPGVSSDETALAAAAEARALARIGDTGAAEEALTRAQHLTEHLNDHDSDEAFRFTAKRLMLYMSGTLTNMGHIDRARRVQDEALRLYRKTQVIIDPALIHLDAAVSHVQDGAADDGCALAAHILADLPADHRTRIVVARAGEVLKALPTSCSNRPTATSLRELVHAETTAVG